MFCRKCGKEIKEGVKFCPYCGAETTKSSRIEKKKAAAEEKRTVKNRNETEVERERSEQNKQVKKNKKWIKTVGIILGIFVLCGSGIFAMYKAGEASEKKERKELETEEREKEKIKGQEGEKEAKVKEETKDSEETSKEPDVEYPQEVTLEPEVQDKIIDFLSLLCKLDTAGGGKKFSQGVVIDQDFAYSFLIKSIWFKIPFVDGNPAQLIQEGWLIPEETVREYLGNSIGIEEFNTDYAKIEDGNVMLEGVTPTGAYGNDTPQILQVLKISETEIEVSGEVQYTPEAYDAEPYTAVFDVTMIANAESMWGGYTLESVNSWTEKKTAQDTPEGQKNPLNFQVSASSVLQEEGYDHSTTALSDMDPSTCWIEGVEGTGVGEDLLFTSGEKQSARGLAILPGYLSSEDIYNKNGIPLEIKIQAGDRVWTRRLEEYHPDFAAPMNSIIYIDFGQSISVDWCRVTITDSRSGTKYDDICIAEMFLYGE